MAAAATAATKKGAVSGTLRMNRQERIVMLVILSVSAALILSATVTLIMWAQGDISFPVEPSDVESQSNVRIKDGKFVLDIAYR